MTGAPSGEGLARRKALGYPHRMSPPSSAAAVLAPSPAAERLTALLSLPLREAPETAEEAAIFERAEEELRAGLHGARGE